MKVAVLGASPNPERYSNRALHRLKRAGHEAIGVNPGLPDLGEFPVVASIADLPDGVDTLTVYVAPERSSVLADEIVARGFQRVIFNPGAENPVLRERLGAAGSEVLDACTLVMLGSGQF